MNQDDSDLPPIEAKPGADMSRRPSRARYDKVKHALDLKWRRRAPQTERMQREIVDGLWDAFGGNPWSFCGFWIIQPDGQAFQPGPARPEHATGGAALEGLRGGAFAAGASQRKGGEIAVPALDKNGKPWAVFEAKSSAAFEDMDARWIEQLLKVFQTIERPAPPLQ